MDTLYQQKKSALTRDRIIIATLECIITHGYDLGHHHVGFARALCFGRRGYSRLYLCDDLGRHCRHLLINLYRVTLAHAVGCQTRLVWHTRKLGAGCPRLLWGAKVLVTIDSE